MMRYRYTVRGGYDRLLKQKVEKGTLFAMPLAVMAIVGFAALTSNTTHGPGIGSPSKGTSGHSTVTQTFQTTANTQSSKSTTGGQATSSTQGSANTKLTSSSGSNTQGGGASGSLATATPTANSLQSTAPNSTAPSSNNASSGGTSGGAGTGGDGGSTTLLPGALPVTVCTKQLLDPVTGQEVCVN